MSKLTYVFVILLSTCTLAQTDKTQVVVDAPAAPGWSPVRASFVPRDVPYFEAGPSVSVPAVRSDARLPDGQIVSGFAFIGWSEGDSTRVMVFALTAPKGATNTYMPSGSHDFERRDFATYRIASGGSVQVAEMRTLGLEPITLSVRR